MTKRHQNFPDVSFTYLKVKSANTPQTWLQLGKENSQKSSKVFVLFSTGLFTVALLLTRPSGRKMTLVSREAQVEATPRAQNLTPIRIPRLLPSSVMGNIWQWCCNLTNHVVKKFLRWRLQKGGCKPPPSTIRRWKSVIVNKPLRLFAY